MRPSGKIVVERTLIESRAFQELRGISVKVLLHFLAKRQFRRVKSRGQNYMSFVNNGEIVFTYGAAGKLGISRQQFAKALDELISRGFLEVRYRGGGLMGDTSRYWISDRWQAYGTDAFRNVERARDGRRIGFVAYWKKREGERKGKYEISYCPSMKNHTAYPKSSR